MIEAIQSSDLHRLGGGITNPQYENCRILEIRVLLKCIDARECAQTKTLAPNVTAAILAHTRGLNWESLELKA